MAKQQLRKAETQKALVSASSRAFRSEGFSGVGVDAIAKAAGATSGAFYAHLGSKDGAFHAALEVGLDEVITTIPDYRDRYGDKWVEAFAKYYLGSPHRKDRACGCAMTALSPDVARAKPETRDLYDSKMRTIAALIADGLKGGSRSERESRAWAFLSILIGGLTTARAMSDETLAETVTAAALPAALQVAGA
ncbi:transcriptional regulator, TetR family protein [Stappia aggregata IAM 12614]|uniref:Transcriptional regulator, TetR family protein n=1 Tax=Roseibium aggregatum (strain ATCC 25650 / DSM 13394 / JCM 20685 / NBRC 16684 / NCIMB 2208 / IAM 12614 / B1) TaxID=384765 RepID=A0NVJ6_ROSAI|nr:TetR/AcrR family transcriptional regulator [Roseibium aggregatum]EAV43011.1 transcriptional regulator, TetR family protein [Stappia aggregata IAM 12614] [Roseibium aggregatum IAM 12614]